MVSILRTNVLSEFTCLGEHCEDTCCQNWSMQVDDATLERYRREVPELMEAVEQSQDAPWIMKKDPATGFCVKLEGGLCGIHKQYGDKFLGDACYFYPRATRKLGERVLMTATMSCPEIVRRALLEGRPGSMGEVEAERLPQVLKDYLPEGMAVEDALAVHQAFLDAAEDTTLDAESIFLRMGNAARSLERTPHKDWKLMTEFYIRNAEICMPPAQLAPADPFNLLHALCGLIVASRKPPSPRLRQTIADMEKALAVTLDWEQAGIATSDGSLPAYQSLQALWGKEASKTYTPILRRYLQMQVSLALYPFGGFGNTLSERITVIGVRLATIKLALLCGHSIYGATLPQDVVVRIVQSLSRFMDHLGDPQFSLRIYTETGWLQESRMRGLLEK